MSRGVIGASNLGVLPWRAATLLGDFCTPLARMPGVEPDVLDVVRWPSRAKAKALKLQLLRILVSIP